MPEGCPVVLDQSLGPKRVGPRWVGAVPPSLNGIPETVAHLLDSLWREYEGAIGFTSYVVFRPIARCGIEDSNGDLQIETIIGPGEFAATQARLREAGLTHCAVATIPYGYLVIDPATLRVFVWLSEEPEDEASLFPAFESIDQLFAALRTGEVRSATLPRPVSSVDRGLGALIAAARKPK